MDRQIILKPRMSEKTYGLSTARVYVFEVPGSANKHSVARAVKAQFDVAVQRVNITNISGKAKRTISQKGRRVARGTESDTKKAYVTLAEDQSLPFFAAIEEAEEKEEKVQEKVAKAVAKQAEKEKPARRGLGRRKNQVEDDK